MDSLIITEQAVESQTHEQSVVEENNFQDNFSYKTASSIDKERDTRRSRRPRNLRRSEEEEEVNGRKITRTVGSKRKKSPVKEEIYDEVRREKNRMYARNSRERKRVLLTTLQEKIAVMETERSILVTVIQRMFLKFPQQTRSEMYSAVSQLEELGNSDTLQQFQDMLIGCSNAKPHQSILEQARKVMSSIDKNASQETSESPPFETSRTLGRFPSYGDPRCFSIEDNKLIEQDMNTFAGELSCRNIKRVQKNVAGHTTEQIGPFAEGSMIVSHGSHPQAPSRMPNQFVNPKNPMRNGICGDWASDVPHKPRFPLFDGAGMRAMDIPIANRNMMSQYGGFQSERPFSPKIELIKQVADFPAYPARVSHFPNQQAMVSTQGLRPMLAPQHSGLSRGAMSSVWDTHSRGGKLQWSQGSPDQWSHAQTLDSKEIDFTRKSTQPGNK